MTGQIIPSELLALARDVIARITAEEQNGGSAVLCRLLASRLYEALRAELGRTARCQAAKIGLLAGAIDQCRRSATTDLSAPLKLAELQATLALLETGQRVDKVYAAQRSASRPFGLTVIEGGLSKAG